MPKLSPARKALLSVLMCLLLCAAFALPGMAASKNVEDTLTILSALQGANIDPEWQPDIDANEELVGTLLTAYQRCSAAEKKEFTSQQNRDIRSYFRALYTAQGLNPADADKLITGSTAGGASSQSQSSSKSAAPSQSVAAPQSTAASSSQSSRAVTGDSAPAGGTSASSTPPSSTAAEVSSSPAGEASSVAAPAPPSAPVNSAPTASLPVAAPQSAASASDAYSAPNAVNPPQLPQGSGMFGFFSSATFGRAALFVLAALAVVVFLRFLAATRAARKLRREEEARLASGLPQDPLLPGSMTPGGLDPHSFAGLAPAEGTDAMGADAPPPEPQKQGWRQRRAENRENKQLIREERQRQKLLEKGLLDMPEAEPADSAPPVEETPWPQPAAGDYPEMDTLINLFADDTPRVKNLPVTPRDDRIGRPVIDEPVQPAGITPHQIIDEPVVPLEDEEPPTGPPVAPGLTRDNTPRGARTGRPPRMRFRQGDANDIDAIDD